MKSVRDGGGIIYDNGQFLLLGNYDGTAQNELWKSTLEKKMLTSEFPANLFSVTKIE